MTRHRRQWDRAQAYESYEYKGISSVWRYSPDRIQEFDDDDRLHFTSKGGLRIKRYLDEMKGVPLNDVWNDITPINSQAKERIGYATQKPLACWSASSRPAATRAIWSLTPSVAVRLLVSLRNAFGGNG